MKRYLLEPSPFGPCKSYVSYVTPHPAIDGTRLRELSRALTANAARYDSEARFPADNIVRLHRAGLLALTVPERSGGGGAGLFDTSRVLGVLAEGCASTTLILAMQLLQHATLARTGLWREQVRARLFADAVEQRILINALPVEPEPLSSPRR